LCFNKQDLLLHNSSVHKADPRPFQVRHLRQAVCATAAYLCQHRRIHTGQRPYGCKYCDKRFTQLSHVSSTTKRIHTGDKPYRCWHCAQKATSAKHTKDKPHRLRTPCHMCFGLQGGAGHPLPPPGTAPTVTAGCLLCRRRCLSRRRVLRLRLDTRPLRRAPLPQQPLRPAGGYSTAFHVASRSSTAQAAAAAAAAAGPAGPFKFAF
uniref:C2H2-type domain-containing protein n=1 Tax=Macrostomum lignano TaxID=282301 RepID=A0A1I8JM42_9PLAT